MTENRMPTFTFTQRIGNTNFTVHAYCNDDIAVTYEDKLLELIRGGALQMDASAMQDRTACRTCSISREKQNSTILFYSEEE